MLDAKPLAAGASPTGLHLIADEKAAALLDDPLHDLEILLWRDDESADALNQFSDKTGDFAGRRRADHLIEIARAAHVTARISQAERAAIAIAVDRVHETGRRGAAQSPARVAS